MRQILVTYYPLKKQVRLILRPSTATTDDGDENALEGPKFLIDGATKI